MLQYAFNDIVQSGLVQGEDLVDPLTDETLDHVLETVIKFISLNLETIMARKAEFLNVLKAYKLLGEKVYILNRMHLSRTFKNAIKELEARILVLDLIPDDLLDVDANPANARKSKDDLMAAYAVYCLESGQSLDFRSYNAVGFLKMFRKHGREKIEIVDGLRRRIRAVERNINNYLGDRYCIVFKKREAPVPPNRG